MYIICRTLKIIVVNLHQMWIHLRPISRLKQWRKFGKFITIKINM